MIVSWCLREKTGKGVTSRSYVNMFREHWTYYGMKDRVDLYGKKFQVGGAFLIRRKSMHVL